MHEDILLYKTIIQRTPIALLVEDENRNLTTTNQTFCDLFEFDLHPDKMVGYDCSQLAEQTKHLIINPDSFLQRIEQLIRYKKPAYNELVEMTDGKILVRDYTPVFDEDFYLGHVWMYKDITHLKKVQGEIETSIDLGLEQLKLANLGH